MTAADGIDCQTEGQMEMVRGHVKMKLVCTAWDDTFDAALTV